MRFFQIDKLFIVLFLFLGVCLKAEPINILHNNGNILDQVEISLSSNSTNFESIKTTSQFQKNTLRDINLGFKRDTIIWIKISLFNDSDTVVTKVLEVRNPLLEEIVLYDETGEIIKAGMLHMTPKQVTLNHAFGITLQAKTKKTYYLKVSNHTTSLRFALFLNDLKDFQYADNMQFGIVMMALGVILALLFYNFLIYLYSKKIAYLYYSLYLSTLIFQQITYLGITPLYFPKEFVYIDNLSVLFKVNIMYITAAIFAKEFLETKNYKKIDKVYNLIIIFAILEIPIFGTPSFYYPEVGIVTGLFFVLFNIFAAIYIYSQGHKQARLFIAGWSVLVVGFTFMILDGLGIISIMLDMPNVILYATVVEALLLSLAFTDRYSLLQEEKEKADQLLVKALENRQVIIEAEIEKRTKELSNSLENQKTLLKELHHRTKNNLQLMLSIVRIQAQGVEESLKKHFKNLENRIIAIAKTHEMLYVQKNLQKIDMQQYILELCEKIELSFNLNNFTLQIDVNKIYIPLKEASYIGLLINEIVINAIKYVNKEEIILTISMQKNTQGYILSIKDNGDGKIKDINENRSSGSAIINTIILEQLEGEYTLQEDHGISYTIRFKI
ncbi:7TM diverse intracellular signaling domain-containing protein [Sulfurimonas sp.]|uniref:7TM diverse intracellular signaling domain-containing protein n=1 Tax=Sulfurimonas sp. TaxID=2022749 RepID=UPI003D13E5BE